MPPFSPATHAGEERLGDVGQQVHDRIADAMRSKVWLGIRRLNVK